MPESGTYGSVRGVQGNLPFLPRSFGRRFWFLLASTKRNSPAGARPGRVAVNRSSAKRESGARGPMRNKSPQPMNPKSLVAK